MIARPLVLFTSVSDVPSDTPAAMVFDDPLPGAARGFNSRLCRSSFAAVGYLTRTTALTVCVALSHCLADLLV